jgi:hypothetical protein
MLFLFAGVVGNSHKFICKARLKIILHKLHTTWILPDVWPKAKCARSASEDRDSPAARRAAKHKKGVSRVVGALRVKVVVRRHAHIECKLAKDLAKNDF